MPLMPFEGVLPPDQQLLVDAVRDYARDELLERDRAWDKDETSVAEVLPHLADMGLLTLRTPEELNGIGCWFRTYAAIIHEMSVWSPSTAVTLSVHNMVAGLLRKHATETVLKKVLMNLGEPQHFAAFAVSEAGAGSDVNCIQTSAEKVQGGFRVTGEKMWITNGMHARWFATLVRLKNVPESQQFCAVLIDGKSPGIERSKILGKMGIRGSETAVIHYKDVFVPDEFQLGEIGRGKQVFLSTLAEGRISIATQATGIAEACLSEMSSYAKQREQFGQPIGKFQAIAGMVADSAVELEAAKLLVWRAAQDVDDGRVDKRTSSMAKLYATEAANRIAYRAVQIHGGAGYVNDCRVEQLYRDARVTTIYEGTSEVQRFVIAKEIAGAVRN